MQRFKSFLMSLSFMAWVTPAAAVQSYYFPDNEKEIAKLPELIVTDWRQSRTVIEQSWISETSLYKAKFDLAKFPMDQLLDANVDHIALLAFENVILINSNVALEKKLAEYVANGDPIAVKAKKDGLLRLWSTEILQKLKPQSAEVLRPLLKPLAESSNWMVRQNIGRIMIKASPDLPSDIVQSLVAAMQKDIDSPTRSFCALAVFLNSENNPENLKKVVTAMMEDHKDIARVLRPYSVIQTFIEQKQNKVFDTPERSIPSALKKSIFYLVRDYSGGSTESVNNAGFVRNLFTRMIKDTQKETQL